MDFRSESEKVFDALNKRSKKGTIALILQHIDWQKIADLPDAELLRVPEIGRKRMIFIRSVLARYGFSPSSVKEKSDGRE